MIFLASDHAGYQQKEYIANELTSRGQSFEDLGAFSEEPTDDFVRYARVATEAALKNHGKAILFCGTGVGMSIAANRYKHARAFVGWDIDGTVRAREEDDVNIICLPSRLISKEKAWQIISTFLSTTFSHEARYKRRIEQLDD